MASLKVPMTKEDHIQGDPKALITLVEYGDYQCSFCGEAHVLIKKIQKHFAEKLCFVFRNFPLSEIHPNAEIAAEAAEFAADYDRFWQMHDKIFENQSHLSLPFLIEIGQQLKVPLSKLEEALKQRTYQEKVHKDFLGGVRSGVNGTPTFFINGERYNGSSDYEELVAAINSKL